MLVTIKDRWYDKTLWAGEAESRSEGFKIAFREGAVLSCAVLRRADLSCADLSCAVLSGAVLSGADLSGAVLRGAVLPGAVLSGADLSCADLRRADLSCAVLRRADLSCADLSCADLSCADLSGAVLRSAVLRSADLSGADLSGAVLSGADLSGADLSGADLSGAVLSCAVLRRADLSCADLSCADLSGAVLSGVIGLNKNLVCRMRMLLDQPGKIRLYKLVTEDYKSPMHHIQLTYKMGETVEVKDADTSETLCAAGVNVADLPWVMKEWSPGGRILVVEFEAKDIASIPTGTDGKIRLHRCTVVGEKDLKELGLS